MPGAVSRRTDAPNSPDANSASASAAASVDPTVAGNQTLEKTTLNARRVCTVAGISGVPVAAGCARPLTRPATVAQDVHGISGLDGPSFPEPTVDVVEEHAVDLVHGILAESAEPITLVPTAPLTNIALLLTRYPRDASRIREIVLMGGSTERGNRTPAAEFNVRTDPEAADIVFRSGVPVTMCGLNVTHQALATPDVVARFEGLGTPLGRTCAELLTFFRSTYRTLWGFPDPPLHDPVAVARVIDPALVHCVDANVVVELNGRYTRGATVVDLHRSTGRPVNARVAMTLETSLFWDRMVAAVAALGAGTEGDRADGPGPAGPAA
ncbi:nucleoside hydrolase [Streptomyces sp. NPDC055254]